MKKHVLLFSLLAFLSACGDKTEQQATAPAESAKPTETSSPTALESAKPAAAVVPDKAALTEAAKKAVQTLGGSLKTELEQAMKNGGPVEALNVCNTKAPAIAQQISSEQGLQVGRVSLKNRNPNNAPNEWQSAVLNQFETRKANGEDAANLVYAEVVDKEFRFMKAIPTGAVCLNCHGTQISPAVSAKLTELYPQDKAIGFHEGDLRGAFVVVKNLTQ